MIGEQSASFHPTLSSSCPTTFGQRAGRPARCPAATRRVPRTRRRSRKRSESHSRPTPKHHITRRPRSLRHSRKALRDLGKIRAIPSTCTRASIPFPHHPSPTDTAQESRRQIPMQISPTDRVRKLQTRLHRRHRPPIAMWQPDTVPPPRSTTGCLRTYHGRTRTRLTTPAYHSRSRGTAPITPTTRA